MSLGSQIMVSFVWRESAASALSLKPDKGIWKYFQRVELGNVCCTDVDHLATPLRRAKEHLRHNRELIRRCSRACRYLV